MPSWLPLLVLAVLLLVTIGLVVAAVALLGGGSAAESPSAAPSESPSAVSSSTPTAAATEAAATASEAQGVETSVFDIEAGDCFTAEGSEDIETVLVVDCEQPHVYEAFHVFDHEAGSDDPYPGDDELVEYADAACQPPFEEFVGHDYQTSIWYITSVTPSEETWAQGDREIVCTLNTEDESEVTGSAEGSGE